MAAADRDERVAEKMEMLLAENLYLRQMIGELLLKNQRLREAASRADARSLHPE